MHEIIAYIKPPTSLRVSKLVDYITLVAQMQDNSSSLYTKVSTVLGRQMIQI